MCHSQFGEEQLPQIENGSDEELPPATPNSVLLLRRRSLKALRNPYPPLRITRSRVIGVVDYPRGTRARHWLFARREPAPSPTSPRTVRASDYLSRNGPCPFSGSFGPSLAGTSLLHVRLTGETQELSDLGRSRPVSMAGGEFQRTVIGPPFVEIGHDSGSRRSP